MSLKAKLNPKFYIITVLLFCIVVFGWYGIYILNANEILIEDSSPMDSGTKMILTVFMSVIVLSWSVSLLTLIRQIIIGHAFYMDEEGIHTTATAIMVLAFIFVVPVKRIPYEAIQQISKEKEILTIRIDKSKIQVIPILKPFVRKEYHFFPGFTKEKAENIKEILNGFIE